MLETPLLFINPSSVQLLLDFLYSQSIAFFKNKDRFDFFLFYLHVSYFIVF